ncbi:MAG TPA: hypothetical protein ENJ87_08910 [Gammaproteobacteria bacterium]|nr:hypothetical protein [Gammaproteobacteria bacterium]
MTNHITASVEFYFRGKKFEASVELDLDQYMLANGKIPDLYPLLAKAINLDFYSYEYEMMQTENICFKQARGLAAGYLNDNTLDIEAFETAWKENLLSEELQEIARQELSIDDLRKHPELKQALLNAYKLGHSD